MASYPSRVRPGSPEFDNLVERVIRQESGGNPRAVSPAGAAGLMQIMPGTARAPGLGVRPMDWERRFDPVENRRFGTEYLGALLNRYDGDVNRALAGYNWGYGRADKWSGDPAHLPAETRGYLSSVQGGPANAGAMASSTGAIAAVGADIAGGAIAPTRGAGLPGAKEELLRFGPQGWTGGRAGSSIQGARSQQMQAPLVQGRGSQGGVRPVPIVQPR